MKNYALSLFLIVSMMISIGCFDSAPPTGVTGEVIGCITVGADLYCATKYADRGISDATEVLIGEIDFEITRSQSFKKFRLSITYTDEENDEVSRTISVESLRVRPWEQMFGYKGPGQFEGIFTRVFPGDTVAVAIVNLPTIQKPHQGYIIANLTRPEVEFEIPEEVDDVDILDLIP